MIARWYMLLFCLLAPPGQADIRILDDLGQQVQLPAPATRIITLAPHATEMVLAVGAADRLVAVAQFFDYPAQLRHLPRINTLGGMDREFILDSQPDLVIAWASGNHPGDIQWLKQAGIPLFLSEPTTLEDIARSLEKLGRLTGHEEEGRRAAEGFQLALNTACTTSKPPLRPVYYELWAKPPMTIGGEHWLNEVLGIAGLKNIFLDVPRGVFTVNPENLISADIEAVVTSQPQAPRPIQGATIYHAPPELGRPGPKLPLGLKALCKQM